MRGRINGPYAVLPQDQETGGGDEYQAAEEDGAHAPGSDDHAAEGSARHATYVCRGQDKTIGEIRCFRSRMEDPELIDVGIDAA